MRHPLFLVKTLREAERVLALALPAGALMQRAGWAAARWVEQEVSSRGAVSILILAGTGNNGGDGFVTASHLQQAGYDVTVALCGQPEAQSEEAYQVYMSWKVVGGKTLCDGEFKLPNENVYPVVIDALFGIGLSRPITGQAKEWIDWANRTRALRLSLDIPSGLQADTGTVPMGDDSSEPVVFCAQSTLTFLGDKIGLHTAEGVNVAGRVVVEVLGCEGYLSDKADGYLIQPEDFLAAFPIARTSAYKNSHKGHFGQLAILGGAEGMLGALLLAARAGLHAGAGKVYALPYASNAMAIDPIQPELMFRAVADYAELRASACVIGVGMGISCASIEKLREVLSVLQHSPVPCVWDADALTLLSTQAIIQEAFMKVEAPRVLTPHPLEAARLLRVSVSEVQLNRVEAACLLAKRYESYVVLKGAGSVLASPEGHWCISPMVCPALSVAGTGDVLAGVVGALLAQGMPVWEAAQAGVWVHGQAAIRLSASAEIGGNIGVTASELMTAIRGELNRLVSAIDE